MMSAAATAIVIAAVVVVTVVSALFTAATAVMMRNFNAGSYEFHFKSKLFSGKRMVCIKRNGVAFDF